MAYTNHRKRFGASSIALRGTLGMLLVVSVALAYQNPIIPGFNPDPTILRTGNDYFVATSTFEFFPGVPIYHSKDLIKWKTIGHAFNRPDQLMMRGTAPSGGIFAPTLRYNKGFYYLITTWFDVISPPDNVTRTPRSMYIKTKNIFDETQWSNPIYVDQPGIDPDLFFDDDGKVYLSTGLGANSFGHPNSGQVLLQRYISIFTTEIDITTGNSLTESQFTHQSPFPIDTPRLAEGPHVYKINGTYYLMTAETGTEVQHREMSYRSKVGPYGPWEESPYNPLVFNGRNLSQPMLSTGHADMVQTPNGQWWAVFLGTRPQAPTNSSGRPQLGRETFLAPIEWTKDGWYTINSGKDITLNMSGLYSLTTPATWKDKFEGSFADKNYYTVRTPYKPFHTFLKSGGLSLRGNPYTLSDRETPAAFFRKQSEISTVFSAKLMFSPTSTRHQAGVTIYLSIHYHNEVGITINPNSNKTAIFATTRSGEFAVANTTYIDLPVGVDSTRLFIKAEPSQYSLGYAIGSDSPQYIATVDSKWLQAYLSGWQNFVGSHFGVYVTGNGLPMIQKAKFEYIQTSK